MRGQPDGSLILWPYILWVSKVEGMVVGIVEVPEYTVKVSGFCKNLRSGPRVGYIRDTVGV